jgi:NAD(P)-dependent dehydrogenase (short-subunit alcohol dehydrogenase family)
VPSDVAGDLVNIETSPRLAGRVVLITGAGQGLGKALALAVAAAGATVVLHGRQLKKLEKVYDAVLAQGGPEPLLFPLDLARADEAAYASLAEALATQFGRLDHLVHCAAELGSLAPFHQQGLDAWQELLRVNLIAPAAMTRACVGLLRASGHGRVIFTLADRGLEPKAYWGAYAAAKAGLVALVKLLGDEWENEPALLALGVVPGPMHSPLRLRTHPGASLLKLPPAASLAPLYLELLTRDPPPLDGSIIDAQRWLAERKR